MVDLNEPEPIRETITYDGENLAAVLDWARATLDHYELPRYGVTGHMDGELAKVHIHTQAAWLQPGDQITFQERQGFIKIPVAAEPWMHRDAATGQIVPVPVRQQFVPDGPEILARDHPQTVAEATHLQAAQVARGVTPQTETFVQRRAATDAELAASMARHPSAAVNRRPGWAAGSVMSHAEQAARLPQGRSIFGPGR